MTEVIFGDRVGDVKDFETALEDTLCYLRNSSCLQDIIVFNWDDSWLWIRPRSILVFADPTENETGTELSFKVKVKDRFEGESLHVTWIRSSDYYFSDDWHDLTLAEWEKIDECFDDLYYSIDIPKFGWHVPEADDDGARVAYIKAKGRKVPPSLEPPEEEEKPEPPPAAAAPPPPEPALASSPLFDRRRPPPPLPTRRTPSKPRKTRTSVKAAEAAAVAVDDD